MATLDELRKSPAIGDQRRAVDGLLAEASRLLAATFAPGAAEAAEELRQAVRVTAIGDDVFRLVAARLRLAREEGRFDRAFVSVEFADGHERFAGTAKDERVAASDRLLRNAASGKSERLGSRGDAGPTRIANFIAWASEGRGDVEQTRRLAATIERDLVRAMSSTDARALASCFGGNKRVRSWDALIAIVQKLGLGHASDARALGVEVSRARLRIRRQMLGRRG